MSTAKQIAANRRNAQKATGPRTTAGKSTSRFNALKHGIFATHQIMFDETAEDLAELAAEYHEHHRPSNPEERFLVDTLVHNEWRLRRMRRVEADLWRTATILFEVHNLVNDLPIDGPVTSGDAFHTDSSIFERLQRIVSSCERSYHRARKELAARAQCVRTEETEPAHPAAQPEPAPQPQDSTPTSEELASFRQDPQPGPVKVWPKHPSRFPTAMETIDAALEAISKQSAMPGSYPSGSNSTRS